MSRDYDRSARRANAEISVVTKLRERASIQKVNLIKQYVAIFQIYWS